MAMSRSWASVASRGVFAHWRRITSPPTWMTTCQCFFSGFHSTLALAALIMNLLPLAIDYPEPVPEGSTQRTQTSARLDRRLACDRVQGLQPLPERGYQVEA